MSEELVSETGTDMVADSSPPPGGGDTATRAATAAQPLEPPVPTHHPWNGARAAATGGVVALTLGFALAALVLGNPLYLVAACTLMLVAGILRLMVPREPGDVDGDGGKDEQFIVRLLQALLVLKGGGGFGGGGSA